MKFSEKMLLIKQGATMAEIRKLEEEEAAEAAEVPEVPEVPEESEEKKEILSALEAANKALEESRNVIQKQKDELEALNEKFTVFANQQTITDPPAYTEKEVMQELFNSKKKEE